ncbi:MAG: RagB/SusD family nutrient uptake outer membrane protein [Dysgonamonadaceae bacterium]|jgi:hypothetical protein|nr:RagB/SusD family nutrient uptake outer membrane protein [Dysgonamonadaceae bacterium]
MKKIFIFLLLLASPILYNACDYLEKPASDDITIDMAFQNVITAKRVLNNLYWEVRQAAYNLHTRRVLYATATDDAIAGYSIWGNKFHEGAWTPDDNRNAGDNAENDVPTVSFWNNTYKRIRRVNLFLENLERAAGDETEKQLMFNEARFLRAFFYAELVRRFGGVILLEKSIDPSDYSSLTDQGRNTYAECVEWVVKELDEAAKGLPEIRATAEVGRATTAACYAVKARFLLTAASPLFNTDSPVLPDYTEIQYWGNYSKERWKAAADAARTVMNMNQNYGLDVEIYDQTNPTSFDNYFKRFSNIFFKVGRESVWICHPEYEWDGRMVPFYNRSAQGWNWINPTMELADQYEMTNGKLPSDPESGFDFNKPGNNRDPRFKATISYPGAQYARYNFYPWIGGTSSHLESQKTGFCIQKFVDEDYNAAISGLVVRRNVTQIFRFAEILLIFAEAQNEYVGPDSEVYDAVNAVRARVGMPALPSGLSMEQMREKIRHERRVELAFEDHRFFDVRRWRIAEETQNGHLHGYDVTKGENSGFYAKVTVGNPIKFEKKHYLYPLSTQEILLNPSLQQNPGWPVLGK